MNPVLLALPAQRPLAQSLADALPARLGMLEWRHFPDGESLVSVDGAVDGADVALVASLDHPDAKALPLRFAAETARALGARSVGLVAPYLGYMRQDTRFHPGEAVSAPLFARFLEESFDWLVTVDPHLHRTRSLAALFGVPAINVAAAPAIAEWVRVNIPKAVVVGPDEESGQWVAEIARLADAPWQTLTKVRLGDDHVVLSAPLERHAGRTPVLVDDIASSGATLAAALAQLERAGMAPAACIVTHGIFADGALERLRAAGAVRIVSTDTVSHPTNAIGIAASLLPAVRRCLSRTQARAPESGDADQASWLSGDTLVP